MFQKQQEKAFYELGIENVPLEEFMNSVPFVNDMRKPEFPSPETIYTKKFNFLSAPLINMQRSKKVHITPPSVHNNKFTTRNSLK